MNDEKMDVRQPSGPDHDASGPDHDDWEKEPGSETRLPVGVRCSAFPEVMRNFIRQGWICS